MKHVNPLSRAATNPAKAVDIDTQFQFFFNILDLLAGIQDLILNKTPDTE